MPMTERAKRRKFLMRRLLAIGLLAILLAFLALKWWRPGSQTLHLANQHRVSNFIQFDIQPVRFFPGKAIWIHVKVVSTQNQDAIQSDFLKTTLLLDDQDAVYAPIEWKPEKESAYERSGILVFPIKKKPRGIKLSFFELEEHIFEWQLQSE